MRHTGVGFIGFVGFANLGFPYLGLSRAMSSVLRGFLEGGQSATCGTHAPRCHVLILASRHPGELRRSYSYLLRGTPAGFGHCSLAGPTSACLQVEAVGVDWGHPHGDREASIVTGTRERRP